RQFRCPQARHAGFGTGTRTGIRLPKFEFGPHHGLRTVKSQGKTNFLGDLEHVEVFGQDKPENALKPFLPTDVDKKLEKASSEPLSLEAITDFYGELCLGHTMSLHQPAHANNLGLFHLRFLPNRYESHLPVVIDETDSGQLFVGDTQLEIFLSKVTEKHGFLGQRTVELDHKRFILRPDRSNDYRSSVPKFPRTGILFGIGVGTTDEVAPPSEPSRPISGTRLSSWWLISKGDQPTHPDSFRVRAMDGSCCQGGQQTPNTS